jgi:3(or 17)beta-hydroxysteroid dehydrogenase
MMTELDPPIAVVTGAARGVGAATAIRLGAAGYRVYLLDIDDRGSTVAASVGGTFIRHDVSRIEDWSALEATLTADGGTVTCLVNNAAIERRVAFEELALDVWQRTIDVNLTGTFLGSRLAVRLMRNNPTERPGAIVNVASVAAHRSIAADAPYTASKGGIISLTKAVAHYCAGRRWPIRCNVVSPGAIRTEMVQEYIASSPHPAATEAALLAAQPSGAMADASDVANLIYYLASAEAAFITGAEVFIDGGRMASANV